MDTSVLGFSDNNLRFLRINSSREVISSGEADLGFSINDISYLKKNKEDLMNVFSLKLGEFISQDEIKEMNAGIIIDSSQTFLNIIPIDFNENKNNINSLLLWELSNYYPDNYKDFSVRYLKLKKNLTGENVYEVLLIAIDRNKLNFIKSLCNGIGIRIKNIEIDQFASEKYVKENYNTEGLKVLLAGFKNNRMDFSINDGSRIIYYDYGRTSRQSYLNVLKKLLNSFRLSSGPVFPDRVYIYGDGLSEELETILYNEFGKNNVIVLSPLINQKTNPESSTFVPLFGLALKNLS